MSTNKAITRWVVALTGIGSLMATTANASISNYVLGTKIGIWYYDG